MPPDQQASPNPYGLVPAGSYGLDEPPANPNPNLPGAGPKLVEAVKAGKVNTTNAEGQDMSAPTEFEKERDPANQESGWMHGLRTIGNQISDFAANSVKPYTKGYEAYTKSRNEGSGIIPSIASGVGHGVLAATPGGEALEQATNAAQVPEEYKARREKGYSSAYAAAAPVAAGAAGVNLPEMEHQADIGNTGGVVAEAAVPAAEMAAGEAIHATVPGIGNRAVGALRNPETGAVRGAGALEALKHPWEIPSKVAEAVVPAREGVLTPAQRAASEADATERTAILKRTEVAAAKAARDKAAADAKIVREGKPVPVLKSPNITPEGKAAYEAGRQQMTTEEAARAAEPQRPIPTILGPEAPTVAPPADSEGTAARWTNEDVNRLALQGNRTAIEQLARRGKELPPNTRYIAGDLDMPRSVSSPREVTRFSPEGTPIRTGEQGVIPQIETGNPRAQGGGIPNIEDTADKYLQHIDEGAANHPEAEPGKEAPPNAAAASRLEIGQHAAEQTRPIPTIEQPGTEPGFRAGTELGPEESTQDRFFNQQTGQWAPERQAIHDQVAQKALAGKTPPVGRPPEATITMGGTGAGKSTVTRHLMGENPNVVNIDSDANKLSIPEYEKLKQTDPKKAAFRVHEESSAMAKNTLQQAVGKGLDFVYDTTTGGSDDGLYKRLKDNGYKVKIVYADVPVDEAIKRANLRAESSTDPVSRGRTVPESIIRAKHKEAAQKFLKFQNHPHVDEIRGFDTTTRTPQEFYNRTGNSPAQISNQRALDAVHEKAETSVPVS